MKTDDYFSTRKWNWLVSYIKDVDRNNSILPFTLRLDLTVDCNFACPNCLYQSKVSTIRKDEHYSYPDSHELDYSSLVNLIKLFAKRGLKSAIITGGGEPFVYEKFEEVLDVLFKSKIEVGIITNGTKLTPSFVKKYSKSEYLKWIRFSLDAATEKTWHHVHRPVDNSSFKELIKNIRLLVDSKDRGFLVGINFLVMPANYKEIVPAYQLAKDLGVDNIRYTPVFTKLGKKIYDGIRDDLDDEIKKVIGLTNPRVQVNLPRFNFLDKPNNTKRCWFSNFSINLGIDSTLYPCCLKKYVKGMGVPLTFENFDENLTSYFRKMKRFNALSCKDCMYHQFNEFCEEARISGSLDNFIP